MNKLILKNKFHFCGFDGWTAEEMDSLDIIVRWILTFHEDDVEEDCANHCQDIWGHTHHSASDWCGTRVDHVSSHVCPTWSTCRCYVTWRLQIITVFYLTLSSHLSQTKHKYRSNISHMELQIFLKTMKDCKHRLIRLCYLW